MTRMLKYNKNERDLLWSDIRNKSLLGNEKTTDLALFSL